MTTPGTNAATLWPSIWLAFAILLYGALFIVSRTLYIDQDAPPFWFAIYSPVDELYSTIPAFNLLQHGTWTHK